MLSTRAERKRKIIIHRENGTPTMPETDTRFSNLNMLWMLEAAPAVYRSLVGLKAGQRLTIAEIEADVRVILTAYDGENGERDDDMIAHLIVVFILDAVGNHMVDDGQSGWLIPTQPLV